MNKAISENCFAGLDIGSHTTRLLIAEKSGQSLVALRSERRVTRLAEGFNHAGAISEKAQRRNIEALKEYASILGEFEVVGVSCGATGVVRRAQNFPEVLGRIAAETGLDCKILSEDSEARLSAKGILSAIDPGAKAPLFFDVGGGSTEFILPGSPDWVASASRPIGAATLTEAYLAADPPGAGAVNLATLEARRQIEAAKEMLYENLHKNGKILPSKELMLAGTAGTLTTLAAIKLRMNRYEPHRVNGAELFLDWILRTIEEISLLPRSERRKIAGLEPGREEIILAGAVIVSQILFCFGAKSCTVSDAGLLEGLVIEIAEREDRNPGEVAPGLRTDLTWRRPKR
ncbi:MAG: hypothetical protein P4L43_17440 [Syntrophobacteraceae bacterium]|nr:hypothetical protein [Syntrophobacteraceae bacterium]